QNVVRVVRRETEDRDPGGGERIGERGDHAGHREVQRPGDDDGSESALHLAHLARHRIVAAHDRQLARGTHERDQLASGDPVGDRRVPRKPRERERFAEDAQLHRPCAIAAMRTTSGSSAWCSRSSSVKWSSPAASSYVAVQPRARHASTIARPCARNSGVSRSPVIAYTGTGAAGARRAGLSAAARASSSCSHAFAKERATATSSCSPLIVTTPPTGASTAHIAARWPPAECPATTKRAGSAPYTAAFARNQLAERRACAVISSSVSIGASP